MINIFFSSMLNILGLATLMYFFTRIRELKKHENVNEEEIVFKSGIDKINICLSLILILLLAWRVDIFSGSIIYKLNIKVVFKSGILTYMIIACGGVYFLINRMVLTKKGIVRFNAFSRIEEIIPWQQVVGYRWEEDCLLIDYIIGDKVSSYLWRNISFRDKKNINRIFNCYIDA